MTNGLATITIYLAAWALLFQYLLLPLWCLVSGLSTYLVCMKTSTKHLVTGMKMTALSIIIGFFMVPTLQNFDLGNFGILLLCYLIGGIGGAYYSLKTQLQGHTKGAVTPQAIGP